MPKLLFSFVLLFFFSSSNLIAANEALRGKEKPCCVGKTFFSCICPGDKVCPANDGEYDYPFQQCDKPLTVTAQNIDNIVGNLRLADPPCEDPKNCRRISVLDSFAAPQKNPACRCRDKTAVCKPVN